MNKQKPKVGDVLFVTRRLHVNKLGIVGDSTVTKVGSKYFYTDNCYQAKFDNKTWRQVTDYSASYFVYQSRQEYEDRIEMEHLRDEIRKAFSIHGNTKALTLDDLREIKRIIGAGE